MSQGQPAAGRLAVLLVEAASGLVSDDALLDHAPEEVGRGVDFAALVVGDELIEVRGDVEADVDAGEVGQPEGGHAGTTDEGTGQGVDLLDREPLLDHRL